MNECMNKREVRKHLWYRGQTLLLVWEHLYQKVEAEIK